jgi:hypothetical protein
MARPTRRQQPYRDGQSTRAPGPTLDAMRRGRTAGGLNPMDNKRALAKKGTLARKLMRLWGNAGR